MTTPDTTTPHGGAPTLDAMAALERLRDRFDRMAANGEGPLCSSDGISMLQFASAAVSDEIWGVEAILARPPAVLSRLSGPAADAAGLVDAVRPEVAAFALLMERELRANDHKGGWKSDDPVLLADRVWQETEELRDVIRHRSISSLSPPEEWPPRIASEAADVANMAMMVADVCGCLDGLAAGAPRLTLNEWAEKSHRDQAKWWANPATGEPVERNDGELLMLMVSEISEAMEGIRKNLMDDKLPHRRMVEVEMADLFIRMMDFAGARGLDLDGAVAEKTAFNAVRKDHTFEARLAANGKKF